jgi:AbiV family abortive infection protein
VRAAQLLLDGLPAQALAIGQIGQEELGKSWQLLTAFRLEPASPLWRGFWSDWRSHRRKAYAAFFYEWLNPFRVQAVASDGQPVGGWSQRESITSEKEVGLYVDFDDKTRTFLKPSDSVERLEAVSRLLSLVSLTMTAGAVHDTLVERDPEFAFTHFAAIPARISAAFTLQETVPALYDDLASRSEQHADLIVRLRSRFERNALHLEELARQRAESRVSAAT